KALSGGQRQRVAIGRAIVREPKAFLFDEPLSNLDAELRVTMRKELAALHANIGGTMIYVTHDQTEAMTLADQIVVLNQGRVEQAGPPLELYNTPQNLFVAGFIGSPRMNIVQARLARKGEQWILKSGQTEITINSLPDLVEGEACSFGIRPEHIKLANVEEADASVIVELTEQLGGETYIYCRSEDLGAFNVHQAGQIPVKRGEPLHLNFERSSLHLFDKDGKVLANGLG
ncbi:MAG: TOBE domain-containing protein, partial [SAR324 cluster bacterium]|nr:TOBE domain-containing protein [SAR324 cluster bacterium]